MKPLAVVIGSAACWPDDLEAFHELYKTPHDVIAVNDAGWLYEGRVDHWVTLHPENMVGWAEKRRTSRWTGQLWTGADRERRAPGYDWNTIGHWGTGSSSLFAVAVAQYMGYDRVVLCGVPMSSQPHAAGAGTWEGEAWPEREVQIHREGWVYHKDRIAGMCRSMSGWTRELLGEPEDAFLYDRTPTHARMAQNTVRPPMNGRGVAESFWHCPSCGATRIYKHQYGARYHCGDCGRDYAVTIDPKPWHARSADELVKKYPPDLLPISED